MTVLSPAEKLEVVLKRVEAKVDCLTGDFQDLRSEVESSGLKLPSQEWISTTKLGELVGVTNRTICKWIQENKFPKTSVKERKRGKGFVYRLRTAQAVKVANSLVVEENK